MGSPGGGGAPDGGGGVGAPKTAIDCVKNTSNTRINLDWTIFIVRKSIKKIYLAK